ncbi:hypothetical protein ACB092_09G135000 [Castanea dentata]
METTDMLNGTIKAYIFLFLCSISDQEKKNLLKKLISTTSLKTVFHLFFPHLHPYESYFAYLFGVIKPSFYGAIEIVTRNWILFCSSIFHKLCCLVGRNIAIILF